MSVAEPPTIDDSDEIEWTAVEGREVMLPCRVRDGLPTPVVHWTKDNVTLTPNDPHYRVIQGSSTHWLAIPVVRYTHSRLYIHTYVHNSAQSYMKTERLCNTKVHPYTSNKLNKSNVKNVRFRARREAACESVGLSLMLTDCRLLSLCFTPSSHLALSRQRP